MLSLIEIRDRIRANIGTGLAYPLRLDQCNVAANEKVVMANQAKVEFSIHVIPSGDHGEEGGSTGMTISRVEAGINILISVKDVSDAIGSEGQDTLKNYRQAVSKVLQGFIPTDTTRPLWYSDGDLIEFKDGIFWQVESYSCGYNIREIV